MSHAITFARLTDVNPADILAHMSHPRLKDHMPLLKPAWTMDDVTDFITQKEACWQRDGLGHWAFLNHGDYVGWGGFQKEEKGTNAWDFGLVLRPDCFGLGLPITKTALQFARSDPRIKTVTFLLPPTRTKLAALKRIGAQFIQTIDYDGERFMQFQVHT